jgi:hypothetical protein
MKPPRTIKETLLVFFLFALGVFALPAFVYFVGLQVVGDYEAGLPAFYESIGDALTSGNPFAWLLVLSPLLSIELVRFWLWLRRQRPGVN